MELRFIEWRVKPPEPLQTKERRYVFHSVCALPHTEPDSNTEKMVCVGLCGGVRTAQRQLKTQIPIGFCVLVIDIGLGLVLG